ncbi:Rrf2 family transcriptional regulator [Asticcacaulis sp. SL142]|uniref:Rrf2 family transcriptional regulator n=1 Tax=Asticcacaulis sp. SL142 TaxID=2995155 RepID=UPI00226CC4AA|nr:Rrf2 family transcriptional regulator [Asticcacaulis sp. SL142]WAC46917.1 Rrf2 family transcriptional regulator [Asticcacaulis sp. SL142]
MKHDNRLSSVLHVLIHMIELDRPVTSAELAVMLNTNPVVVRRTMAGLREAGFVASEKGHGGGWVLSESPAAITLFDIHQALGITDLFTLGHRSDNPRCLVEQAVNAALDDAMTAAEALLMARLKTITLADLTADFQKRMEPFGQTTLADMWNRHLKTKGDSE